MRPGLLLVAALTALALVACAGAGDERRTGPDAPRASETGAASAPQAQDEETTAVVAADEHWRHLAIGELGGSSQPPSGGPSEAEIEALRRDADAHPEDPQRRRRLAIALHTANRKEDALREFLALAAIRRDPRTLLDLALAYSSISRLDDSARTYEELLARVPDHAIALHNLGNIALNRDQPERAIELYRRAIAAKPDYLLAHFHLGDALKQAGRYREAYTTYARVIDLEATNQAEIEAYENALYNMAALDITMGAHARAAEMLRELIHVNPQHHSAHYAYGQALLLLGKPDEAQRAFERHMQVLAARRTSGTAAMGE